MTILYGATDYQRAFERYYRATDVPIAKKMRGLIRWNRILTELGPGVPNRHQFSLAPYAELAAAVDVIGALPEGAAAGPDPVSFATGTFEFLTCEEERVKPR